MRTRLDQTLEHCNGRAWMQGEYVFDPGQWRSEVGRSDERRKTMAHCIIRGDAVFADETAPDLGIPWRCSTAGFLTEVVERIDRLDVAAARHEFSVAEMVQLDLYKVHPEGETDETFDRLMTYLRDFADRCRGIAAHGLGLVITMH
ncbi:DUF1877 family protein [Paractinoplanes maris]|uniref:DUF1877 family protein n=1 Tax=Paractinoplanes maris TaxID=1734446 RepID=UPI0020212EE2|nr:DUF1877 family protein [Actinoplanes maris]